MKTEGSLATLAAAANSWTFCDCCPQRCTPGGLEPALSFARRSTEQESSAPARGAASIVLWRHLRSEFAASEATEGRLSWLLWAAGLVTIGCFLAAVL